MDFWTNLFHETDGNSVLELAAGTGRLAQVFLREGAQYTGLEIESDFVKIAENKLSKYDDFATIVKEDMRAFKMGNN